MTRPAIDKFPDGLAKGMRIVTNTRFTKAYSKSPKRTGTIIAGCSVKDFCRVQWDGLKWPQTIHKNFF